MQRGAAGGRADDQLVIDSVKMCLAACTDISHVLKDNNENLGEQAIDKIREKIASISGDAITGRFMHGKTTETIESVLAEHKSEDGKTPEELKRNIRQRLEQVEKAYDVKKEPDYAQVVGILQAPGSQEMDDDVDLMVVEKGLKDADIVCPFTQQPYKDPMKNPGGPNHAACIHHVSRMAVDQMCKSKAIANCPVGGCKGKWSKANAVLDEDFQRRVARFLRAKQAQQGGAHEAEAHDVDNQNDYTQL